MDKKLWLPLLIGVGVVGYFWYKNKYKKESAPKSSEEAVAMVTEKEKSKYTPAFLSQYDIVLPSVQASKVVKEAAFALQADRKMTEINKMENKKPVYI